MPPLTWTERGTFEFSRAHFLITEASTHPPSAGRKRGYCHPCSSFRSVNAPESAANREAIRTAHWVQLKRRNRYVGKIRQLGKTFPSIRRIVGLRSAWRKLPYPIRINVNAYTSPDYGILLGKGTQAEKPTRRFAWHAVFWALKPHRPYSSRGLQQPI